LVMLRRDRADASAVTWFAPRHLILPAVLVCALAGLGILWSTFNAPVVDAPWAGLYSSEKWDVVKADFSHRGFDSDSVHVVTATTLANGRQFAIIGGMKDGHACVAVARGTAIATTICRISKPVMVFYAPDTCAPCSPGGPPKKTLSVLGLIRGDVTVTVSAQGHEGGLGGVPAGIGFAFNSSFASGSERIRARDASGRVVASFFLRPF
jgi:hypothetical protein